MSSIIAERSGSSTIPEALWEEVRNEYLNGLTIEEVASKLGVHRTTVFARAKRYYWQEQREYKRMGLTWNGPNAGNGSVPVSVDQEEMSEAIGLKKRHDKAYYARLDKILATLENLEEIMSTEKDPMKFDYLTKSYDRMIERYRILSGKPLPPVIKASEPKKQIQAPSAPIDA